MVTATSPRGPMQHRQQQKWMTNRPGCGARAGTIGR
jgi:hypothetical protein